MKENRERPRPSREERKKTIFQKLFKIQRPLNNQAIFSSIIPYQSRIISNKMIMGTSLVLGERERERSLTHLESKPDCRGNKSIEEKLRDIGGELRVETSPGISATGNKFIVVAVAAVDMPAKFPNK